MSTWVGKRVSKGQRGRVKEQRSLSTREPLKKTRKRKVWKDMIALVLKGYGREIESIVEMFRKGIAKLLGKHTFQVKD